MTLDTYLNVRSTLAMQRAEAEMRLIIAQRELDKINQEIDELDNETIPQLIPTKTIGTVENC
jgi:hypothetical protein